MAKIKNSLVNVNPIRKLNKVLQLGNVQNNHPRVVTMYKNWTKIYRKFIHDRFRSASQGDGTWPSLSARTIARKKSALILIETRSLINAVDPELYNAPGSFARRNGNGLLVGYGGDIVHPTAAKNGRATSIAEVAEFHQAGSGKLPQRKIIVAPDRATIDLVAAEIGAATRDLIKEVGI